VSVQNALAPLVRDADAVVRHCGLAAVAWATKRLRREVRGKTALDGLSATIDQRRTLPVSIAVEAIFALLGAVATGPVRDADWIRPSALREGGAGITVQLQ
jgi:hypothetical protein